MKKMTCRDLGGTCDAPLEGETSKEISEKGYAHIKEMQDDAHKEMLSKIDATSEEDKQKWMTEFEQKFNAAPDA